MIWGKVLVVNVDGGRDGDDNNLRAMEAANNMSAPSRFVCMWVGFAATADGPGERSAPLPSW